MKPLVLFRHLEMVRSTFKGGYEGVLSVATDGEGGF